MKTYSLPYGSGSVSFPLDEAQVIAELHGSRVEALDDVRAALWRSLEQPIDSAPLRERAKRGDKVALVVSDMSRFWMRQDLVIPHLVDYLNTECGVPDRDLTIVVANGTHLGGGEQDLRTLVTDAVFERVRVVNHDCRADDLVALGVTPHGTPVAINRAAAEADLVLCLGACTHHVMAGFGGGRKSILPGISSLEAIRHNHAFALDPHVLRTNPLIGNAVLEGNPVHEDMCEAAGLVPNLFIVNLVMNAEMKLAAIFSGHYLASWKRACEEVNRIYCVQVPRRADVIIASCGGYPKDMSLYQGTKAIDNVETGLKPGGTLILAVEAREGGGPAEYFDWAKELCAGTIEQRLRNDFTIPGYIFFLNCEQARRYRIFLYSSVDPELVAPMGIRAYSDMDALLRDAAIGGKDTYIIPNASTVIPYVAERE
ncbi:MAG: nickel-dependent lactate racemase [Ruminococcaceae bacterium]|nr:nickel-dependent lactate racemase [Oscillospiraceae bacterium]